MILIFKGKIKLWEIPVLLILFLFSVSLFNRGGYIFSAVIAVMLVLNLTKIRINLITILLMLFSIFYFLFDWYHNGVGIETVIQYLLGPWTAYLLGKFYVERAISKNAFMIFLVVLSAGMFIHGVLNWYAYIDSSYFETYEYYRRSVDFWRKDLVAVTVTGMYYTFASGLSLGVIFSKSAIKYKIIASVVVAVSVVASVFFANRTLIAIIAIIAVWKIIKWFLSNEVKPTSKVIAFTSILACSIVVVILIAINFLGITDWLSSLKIVRRFTDENESTRFIVWSYFFKDLNFLRYPFGGGNMLVDTPLRYLHNLWLDVYNSVGVLPFALLIAVTVNLFGSYRKFKTVMLLNNKENQYVIFQCLVAAIVLNCAVEPIIEANPYYFLIVLMFFGAMEGYTNKLCDNQVNSPLINNFVRDK